MNTEELIKYALEEDIGSGDATTIATIPEDKITKARIISKDTGIICGINLAKQIFKQYDNSINVKKRISDGDEVRPGTLVIEIEGKARSILSCERTVLNFIQRLSGIATTAHKYSQITKPYGVKILDTRKTSPLLRELEKYAVKIGGGTNHRIGLYDMILIKDNHIAVSGSIKKAINQSRKLYPKLKVEVETEKNEMVQEALDAKADRIMLDNMTPELMTQAVKMIRKNNNKTEIEASGGMEESKLKEVAKTGVDFISIGSALTNASKSLDLSLDIDLKK